MNTLTINSKAAQILSNAATKAREVKPRVRKTSQYGIYEVEASDKSKWYTVTCNSKTREITCNCPARKPCYHIAAVAPLHSYIAKLLQEAAQEAAEPLVYCTCGKPAFAHFEGAWWCIECITKRAQGQENPEVAVQAAPAPVVVTVPSSVEPQSQADQDHLDVFGFIPARRQRVKEEW